MNQKKKDRSDNWTKDEKDILIQLIESSKEVIENRNTDTNTNRHKVAEWNLISQKFIEITGSRKTVAQLKGQWQRVKMLAKKNVAAYKRAVKSTGGGEKPLSPSPDDQKIIGICPVDFIDDDNYLDSDTINAPSTSSTQIKNLYIIKPPKVGDDEISADSAISYQNTPFTNTHYQIVNEPAKGDVQLPNTTDCAISSKNITISCIDEREGTSNNGSNKPKKDIHSNKRTKKEENNNRKILGRSDVNEKILETNKEFKEKILNLQKKEIELRILYQERELEQQKIRHELEKEALLLDIEIKKRKLK